MALNPRITDWHGRVVWIVGASSGIGRATAAALHAQGAVVAVSARKQAALQEFAAAHTGSIALPLDVTQVASVTQAARQLQAQTGRIDLVLACAGHYKAQRATAFDLEDMLRHQSVNYVGCLHVLHAVLPVMLAAGQGHISLMGSVAGYRGLPEALAYGPTKAALNNLAEVLYLDLQDQGLGVSIINPGFVETPLTAQNRFSMPALMSAESAADEILKGWAAGRFEIHFPRKFTWGLKALSHLAPSLYFGAIRRATGL